MIDPFCAQLIEDLDRGDVDFCELSLYGEIVIGEEDLQD